MPAFHWLRTTRATRSRRAPTRRPDRQLTAELLESRDVPAVFTFVTTADGVVTDADGNGTFDTAFAGGDTIPVRHQSQAAGGRVDRAVFEFDASRLAANTPVRGAKLGLDVTGFTLDGSAPPQISFYMTFGDGAVTTADGAAPATLIGGASINSTGYQEFDLTAGAVEAMLRNNPARRLTVRANFFSVSDGSVTIAGSEFGGRVDATLILDIPAPPPVTVTVSPGSVSEAAGPNAATATLTRTGDLSQALPVIFQSSDTTEATVPTAVLTIPAGQAQLSVPVAAVDDAIADGTQTVSISATMIAPGEGPPVGLDTTFGTGGLAQTALSLFNQPAEARVARQADGKLVVLGENGTGVSLRLQRFNADGTVDTTFGANGVVDTPSLNSPNVPYIHDLVIQPDGKILVVGEHVSFRPIVIRYNSDGSLDTTFGATTATPGLRTGVANLAAVAGSGEGAVVLPDGRILLAIGMNGTTFFRAVRLTAAGDLDTSFFGTGIATYTAISGRSEAIALQPDGRFILAGGNKVVRFNANGSVDTAFGVNGIQTLNFGTTFADVFAIEVDTFGRVVLGVGVSGSGNGTIDFAAARLTAAGALDTTFGGDGTVVVGFPAGLDDLPTAMNVQPDGRIVLGGYSVVTASPLRRESALVRLFPNGDLDSVTFDGDGRFQQSLVPSDAEQIFDTVLLPDGKLVALAGWGTDYRLARFNLGPQLTGPSGQADLQVLDNEPAVNNPPVATSWQYATPEDTPLNDILRASDPDGNPLTYTVVSQPSQGAVQLTNAATGAFTFTPAANFSGTVSFTFKVSDGSAESAVQTNFITVSAVNDAPTITAPATFTTPEDTLPFVTGISIADVDAGSAPVVLTLSATQGILQVSTSVSGGVTAAQVTGNGTRTVTVTAPLTAINTTLAAATGLRYRPPFNYNGPDSITIAANDQGNTGAGGAQTASKAIAVTVTPVNDPPAGFPVDQPTSTNEDTPVSGQLTARDFDNDPLVFSGDVPPEGLPAHGTVVVRPDGTYTYTPAADFNGTDVFFYRVTDDEGAFGFGQVTVRVFPVNDAPVARDDAYAVDEDQVLTVSVGAVSRLRMVSEPGDFIGQGSAGGTQPLVLDYTSPVSGITAGPNFDNGVQVRVTDPTVVGGWTLNFVAPGNATLAPGTYLNATRFPFQAAGEPGLDVSGNGRGLNELAGRFTVYDVAFGAGGAVTRFAATFVQQDVNPDDTLDPPLSGAVLFNTRFGAGGGVLANDTDADGDILLSAILVDGPAHGTVALGADGTFVYTPAANYSGPDSFTYRTSDGSLTSGLATVNITVRAVNDAPVAADASPTTPEDTPLTGQLSANDVDGNPLTYALVAGAAHGAVAVNPNGTFTYTPAANYSGPDSFTFKANDGTADSNVATVSITVTPVNDAPTANPRTVTTPEDTPATGSVTGGDVEGSALTFALVTGAAHGTVVMNADGSFTYTPAANYNGPDSFTFKANDGTADSAPALVSITVTPVNDAPTAAGQSPSTTEDTPLAGQLSANDVDGNPLTYALVAGAAHGTVTVNPNGSFTYTPAANYNGPDSFTFKANDGTTDSNVATVAITVTPVNDPPTANPQSKTTAEDTPVTGQLVASDPEGSSLTYAVVTGPAHGTVTVNPAGSFTYTPAANYNGPDSFTFKANDGAADSNTATVSIAVTAVNDAPTAAGQSPTTAEDTPLAGQLGAGDVDGDALTYGLVAGAAHGTVTVNPNGSFTYTPAANYNGPDSFTFKANDGAVDSNVATVSITVTPVNDAPTASPQSKTTAEDTPVTGQLVASDPEGSPLTYAVATGPAHGTVTVSPGGAFTYTPAANYSGPDSFTFRASDGVANSAAATVSITVTPVNDPPTAAGQSVTTPAGTAVTRTLSAADVEGSPLSYAVVTGPAHGTVTVNPTTGSFTYTPAAAYAGSDSFTFKASDGAADSNVATVSITVTSANAAPVAKNKAVTTKEDKSVTSTVTVTDRDDDDLTFAVVTGPAHGTLSFNRSTGKFTYTPDDDYNGPDAFTFKANDGTADSNVAAVSITVTPVDDAPVLAPATFSLPENSPNGTAVGTATGTDADGDALRYSIVGGNDRGAFAINPTTGKITVANSAALDFERTPTFSLTVQVKDPDGLTDTAAVTVRLTNVVEAPRVRIDPNDDDNVIDPNSHGRVKVAILSDADFSALSVNVFSLRFGRTGREDSLSRAGCLIPRFDLRDVDDDGRLDLVVEFDIQDTGFRTGDTKGILTGELWNGTSFQAEDAITVRPRSRC